MEQYVAAHTHRFEFTKHLQIWHFAALNDTRRKTPVTGVLIRRSQVRILLTVRQRVRLVLMTV
jgi:hypothetical protein